MKRAGGYGAEKEKIIDEKNHDGETPLLRAVTRGHLSVVKALIRYGANLGAMDNNNNTVVSNSARNGNLWCLHMLLSLCPPNVAKVSRDFCGSLAKLGSSLLTNNRRSPQKLLEQNDIDDHTPLDWACYKGHTNVAEYLMFRGIEPTHTDKSGRNCLHWAAKEKQSECAAYLVALGMDPRFPDNEGHTALMFALRNRDLFDSMMVSPGRRCGYRAGASMGVGSQFEAGWCGSVVRKRRRLVSFDDLESGRGDAMVAGSTRGLLGIKVQQCLSGLDNDETDKGVNPCLMRANPTRLPYLLFFATAVYGIWAFVLFLPWWSSALLIFCVHR